MLAPQRSLSPTSHKVEDPAAFSDVRKSPRPWHGVYCRGQIRYQSRHLLRCQPQQGRAGAREINAVPRFFRQPTAVFVHDILRSVDVPPSLPHETTYKMTPLHTKYRLLRPFHTNADRKENTWHSTRGATTSVLLRNSALTTVD